MKNRFVSRSMRLPLIASFGTASLLATGLSLQPTVFAKSTSSNDPAATASSKANNHNPVKHVVYIIMDNVHYSDIQQMPHVVKFLHQGTVLQNDHTILDSHTQDGMLSDMTGKYPSQTGVIDQGYYENGQYAGFGYWTNPDPDGKPHVTTTPNWQTFNQNGWNVGAIGAPDMELESTGELKQADMNPSDSKASDYLGVAVHNASGSTTIGSPNLPYLFNAPSWTDPTKTLGGYPGWSDNADLNWSLQATYEMQTHGVPVTFTYLHDAHEVGGKEALPGTYDSTLQSYDTAMNTFFTKLNAAGMSPSNTLFVITTDEGDHLMPQGEQTTNLTGWLANNSLNTADPNNITVYGDSGALVYLKDQSKLPQMLASLDAVPGWNYVADPTELSALHMSVSAAPDRNPSFVLFSKPDVYYGYKGSTDWSYDTGYYWNHGTISPDILDIWAGFVGPGVKSGNTSTQWTDHADTMPTIYSLLGYNLTNQHFDGVPAVSVFSKANNGKPEANLLSAESVFKQLNAPVGQFGMATLRMSTEASINATNTEGTSLDKQIGDITSERDAAAKALQQDILNTVQGHPVSSKQLSTDVDRAQHILDQIQAYTTN
ncbi:alkaline phosphatase family protein [Alicyclobacillus dauci]|uniref:LTA synthase family protein n=1 Tax=Alicyclobacillus dauci TaxID=1475485 RepID=A0ABY6Z2U6_9BACL|nr:alkaline phosphatase family protein [Alicyclobacillus dauci]WAH37156.1 LTA synthase family protein [Alicyclobacillus dauci]